MSRRLAVALGALFVASVVLVVLASRPSSPAPTESPVGATRPSIFAQPWGPAQVGLRYAQARPVGLLAGRPVVVAQALASPDVLGLLRLDDGATWASGPPLPTHTGIASVVSDGRSVLAGRSLDALAELWLLTEASERFEKVAVPWRDPAELDDWSFWGSAQPRLPGGFVLTLTTRLVVIATDGAATVDRLPDGYVVLAPTRDEATYLLGRLADRDGPLPFTEPHRAFLWHVGEETPREFVPDALAVQAGSEDLAMVERPDAGWWAIGDDGRLDPLFPLAPQGSVPDSAGERVAVVEVDTDGQPLGVSLQDPDGKVVASYRGALLSPTLWGGGHLLFMAWGTDKTRPRLVLVEERAAEFPLP